MSIGVYYIYVYRLPLQMAEDMCAVGVLTSHGRDAISKYIIQYHII